MFTREVMLLTGINATELRGAGSGTGTPSSGPRNREQGSHSRLGELAEACGVVSDWGKQARSLGNDTLIETLGRMQRELDGCLAEESARLRAMWTRP